MQLHVDREAGQLTLRHAPVRLGAAAVVAAVIGLGAPVLAERLAPSLIIGALGLTMLAALWMARLIGQVAVLDRDSIVLGAGRRSRRQLPWDEVAEVACRDGKLRATSTSGAVVTGPPCDAAVWTQLVEAAGTLSIPLPQHD